jgi:hypothetical protein
MDRDGRMLPGRCIAVGQVLAVASWTSVIVAAMIVLHLVRQ